MGHHVTAIIAVSTPCCSKVWLNTCLSIKAIFEKEYYLISNHFLQALFQVLCIKTTTSPPKYITTLKCEKLILTVQRKSNYLEERSSLSFILNIRHISFSYLRSKTIQIIFSHIILNQNKTTNPKTCQPTGSTVI